MKKIEGFIKDQGYDQTVPLVNPMKRYIRNNYKDIHPDTVEWLNRGSEE